MWRELRQGNDGQWKLGGRVVVMVTTWTGGNWIRGWGGGGEGGRGEEGKGGAREGGSEASLHSNNNYSETSINSDCCLTKLRSTHN